jgi:RNA polymerase sigma-70 factor (ECF subfamily)
MAARLARGDQGALSEIEADYSAMLRGYLRQALRDPEAVEDVYQQVMIQIWKRGSSFDPRRGSMASWVLTIARTRAIDHMRKRLPEPHDPAVTATLADALSPQEHQAEELLERWRMAHLLARLPSDEARLLRMRFHEELSQTEIAAATGIPLGTVKTRMVRALLRLREMIESEG